MVLGGYLDDQANDNYVLVVKLAAGSDPVSTDDVIIQMQCGTTQVVGLVGAGTLAIEELDDLDDGITDGGEMAIDRGYGLQISGAADCNTLTEIPVYIHVKGAGSTYELLQIDDRTDGAPII